MSGGGSSQVERACWSCGTEGGAVLLRCKGCWKAYYCGKQCQRADWTEHKPLCKAAGGSPAPSPASGRSSDFMSSIFAGKGGSWHEGLGHKEVYERLIDSFRLRRDDDYNFRGDVCEFYGGGDPMPDFEEFIKLAKQREVLPSWWNSDHERKLKKTALTDKWANINHAVEKGDIQDHYADPFEHMALRSVATAVYGDSPWAY